MYSLSGISPSSERVLDNKPALLKQCIIAVPVPRLLKKTASIGKRYFPQIQLFLQIVLSVLIFKLLTTPWSIGWRTLVQFVGKKLEYAVRLSTNRAILLFVVN